MKKVLALLCLFGCTPSRTVDDISCSPKADLWHQYQLESICKDKIIPNECPESKAIGEEYLRREAEECSKKP